MTVRHTLKSVAQAAGVSTAAVSYAFNRPDRVSPHVRAHILDTARSLGYAGPDPAARTLKTRRAGSIGVVVTVGISYVFRDPYFGELLTGVAEVAESSRTGITFLPFDLGPSTPDSAERSDDALRQSLDAIHHALIDGAIADGMAPDHPAARALAERGLPVVHSTASADAVRSVAIDDRGAARRIGEHLAALGHRDVVVVLASAGDSGRARDLADEGSLYPYSRLRLAGFREGLGAGASVRVVTGGYTSAESGRAAAALGLASGPTAIVADSDVLATGVLAELRARGMVPGADVSVTGFDDVAPAADHDLTTVRQPVREKGRVMARMLIDQDFAERHVVLPTELVVRGSTGPAGRPRGRR